MRNPHTTRRRIGFENLERRSLLAAGILGLDVDIPVQIPDSQLSPFDADGFVSVGADLVFLDPSDLTEISVTNESVSGAGGISGEILGFNFEGTYTIPEQVPQLQFETEPDGTLTFQTQVEGTLVLTILGDETDGTFTAILSAEFDPLDRRLTGSVQIDISAAGIEEQVTFPFDLPQAFESIEFPDPSLAAIADRVFEDLDDDGVFDNGEPGVAGVTLELISQTSGEEQVLETTVTDDAGHYSFYNLPEGSFAIRVTSLPDRLDIGRFAVGEDRSLDSDVRSRDGQSEPIELTVTDQLRNLDIALREVEFEWNSPNDPSDVDDSGAVTVVDALRLINFLIRNNGAVELPANRPLGSDFYDVNGDGQAAVSDALLVINRLIRLSIGAADVAIAAEALQTRDEDEWMPNPQLF